ncbi:MAG TPA: FkbM family methyltransferase [Candidatus Polarisedimenticolia bacterium]|nr:FkbM family methyltransferase [Candidatus Polarisedimenticolia bacterium]
MNDQVFGRLKSAIMAALPPGIAGRLRARRARQLIASYQPRVIRHDYGGGPLSLYLADPMAESWYDMDWPELPEIARLRRTRLKPGATVFNLGAHQGVVAMMLERHVRDNGRVIAVEPNPHNVATATRNRDLNDSRGLIILEAAVSDTSGWLTFNQSLNGQLDDGTGAGGRMKVAAVTIDELADRYGLPDVIFLDVEGAECRALAGGRQALLARPDVLIEAHVGQGLEKLGGSLEQLFSYFPEHDYELLGRADLDREFRPVTLSDPLTKDYFYLLALARRPAEPMEPGAPRSTTGSSS